jgi:protein gp37
MKDSNIAWCHATFNPFRGCSGERCPLHTLGLCYAEARVTRLKQDFAKVIPTSPEYWQQPWDWEKEGETTGTALRVFCGSWMDINDRQAAAWRSKLWPIVKATPHVIYMMLTKIPERYPETLPDDWGEGYENVWLGASVLHAEDFRRNTKSLRAVKAKLRFLSMEPLFGPVTNPDFTGISQVIVGGLSGPKWEEHVMDMAWAVDLYHAAKKQGVSYFFKQVSATKDEQGIDAIGKALDGTPRIIREVPDAAYPWAPMRIKGDRTRVSA